MNRRHRNRRDLERGVLMRASDVDGGSRNRRARPGQLWPCLAMRPTGSGPVDAVALAADLARLADIGRRGGCS